MGRDLWKLSTICDCEQVAIAKFSCYYITHGND
jgi:hypothetical protein